MILTCCDSPLDPDRLVVHYGARVIVPACVVCLPVFAHAWPTCSVVLIADASRAFRPAVLSE